MRHPTRISVTHINESTSVRDDITVAREDYSPSEISGDSGNIIVLTDNPIDASKTISVRINDELIDESNYSVNHYEGTITLNSMTGITQDSVSLDYYYLTSLPTEHSIKGQSLQSYNQDQIEFRSLPIKYNGISQITVYIPDETILEKDRDYTVTYLNDGMDFTDIQVEFILGDTLF